MHNPLSVKPFITLLLILMLFGSAVPAPAQMSTDRNKVTDADIARAVIMEIEEERGVSARRIDATSDEGVITLSGSVRNIAAAGLAARLAESVAGVKAVVNELEVRGSGERPDTGLRSDVMEALAYDPAAKEWNIDVRVDNGTVTLGGTVDSMAKKRLARQIVQNIKGVRDIDNRIEIEQGKRYPDSEIREEVRQRLAWSELVDHSRINVGVVDGEVILTGEMESAAEKRRAQQDAWVSGVDRVDVEGLEVTPWAQDNIATDDSYEERSDPDIEEAVNRAFEYNPRVVAREVDVRVVDGKVTLFGTVDNLPAKREAEEVARNTSGVWRVRNYIQVNPETPTDQQVADRIKRAFLRDAYIDRYDITIKVYDGEVTLIGIVDSLFEKARADDVASRIYGVSKINNYLKTENPRDIQTHNPYTDNFRIYDFDWYSPPAYLPVAEDREIESDIKEQLWWSPFVDADQVEIQVEEGVVTLTGTVDSWRERSAAKENALEGGAVRVRNQLQLRKGPQNNRQ